MKGALLTRSHFGFKAGVVRWLSVPLLAVALGWIAIGGGARSAVALQETPAAAQSSQGGAASTPEAQSPEKNKEEEDENKAFLESPTVAAFGKLLGMNPEQSATVFQVLNFLVLAVLLGWALLRALPKFFRTRTGHIQKQIVDARSATEEANARLNLVEQRLGRLDDEIAALKAQAEKDATVEEARVRAAVDDEAGKIVAAAEQEIMSAATQARRQIQQYAAELAIEQAAKKLAVTAETDRLLVQEFARRLGENTPRGGQN